MHKIRDVYQYKPKEHVNVIIQQLTGMSCPLYTLPTHLIPFHSIPFHSAVMVAVCVCVCLYKAQCASVNYERLV